MTRCLVCSPSRCGEEWLYVVKDRWTGHVKVGRTRDMHRRLHQYRREGRDIVLLHKESAGCEFRAIDREEAALKRLAKLGRRVRGDWFEAAEADALRSLRPIPRVKEPAPRHMPGGALR